MTTAARHGMPSFSPFVLRLSDPQKSERRAICYKRDATAVRSSIQDSWSTFVWPFAILATQQNRILWQPGRSSPQRHPSHSNRLAPPTTLPRAVPFQHQMSPSICAWTTRTARDLERRVLAQRKDSRLRTWTEELGRTFSSGRPPLFRLGTVSLLPVEQVVVCRIADFASVMVSSATSGTNESPHRRR